MDANRLADWVTIHVSLDESPNGPLTVGSQLTQTLKLAGRSFSVRWTVVENTLLGLEGQLPRRPPRPRPRRSRVLHPQEDDHQPLLLGRPRVRQLLRGALAEASKRQKWVIVAHFCLLDFQVVAFTRELANARVARAANSGGAMSRYLLKA